MFMSKAGAYWIEAPFRILALLINIILDLKGLPGTNTLAYYDHELITALKSFSTLGPGNRSYYTFKHSN
jgi:hypothetical protein